MKKFLLKIKLWPILSFFLVFTFLLIFPRISFAQDCSVAGTVRDSSENGAAGVEVKAEEQRTGLEKYTTTDQNGYYRLSITCHNSLNLGFRCPGLAIYHTYFIDAWSSGEKIFDPPRRFDCAPPTPTVTPTPGPTATPTPTPTGTIIPTPTPTPTECAACPGGSCIVKECCKPCVEQYSQQTAACTCAHPSPTPGPYPSLVCDPTKSSGRDSRPAECNICNLTNLKTLSCAESFTVHDNVSFYWWEGEKCSAVTPEKYWVFPSWEGIVTINPSETTIPFVGYKGEGKDKSDYEQKYLADYFEGTNEYYQNYGKYWLDWVNHAGVLRKLTPMEYQDKLKENMIENRIASPGAPQEGKVHDYELKYVGRRCWDAPFWADFLLAVAMRINLPVDKVAEIAHYCAFDVCDKDPVSLQCLAFKAANLIPSGYRKDFGKAEGRLSELKGHYPPDPSEENYVEKWQAWKESEWGKLWEVVPMVSREDTPGYVSPYLGWRPDDQPKYIPTKIEKVPHVARLYEATQEVNKLMTPYWEETGAAQKKTEPIIASAGEKVLGEKVLLAQGQGGCFHLGAESQHFSQTDGSVKVFVTVKVYSDGGDGHIQFFINGASQGTQWGWNKGKKNPYEIGPQYTDSPITVLKGSSVSMTYGVKIDECGNRGNWDEITCLFSVDTEGNFSTNCGALAPPPGPACGLAEALPVNSCQLPAITDSNPNDDLCCDPININLTAVDSFNITNWYKECEERQNEIPPRPCGPKTKDVSRQIGINLSHPYLYEIWNQTGESETAGIFNFFRPASVSKFSDIDAASEINYSYCSNQVLGICLPGGTGSVEPSTGKFYYPYLGGVQLAKEWLIQTLTPWK